MNTGRTISSVLAALILSTISLQAAAYTEIPLPPPEIDKQAGVLLTNLRAGRIDTAEIALKQLIVLRKQYNIANLSPVAAAFIGYFDPGTTESTPKKRRQLLETAIELAPDYPALYFKLAKVRLFQGIQNIGPAATIAMDGFDRLLHFPRSASILAAESSFYLIGVLLILYIIFGFGFLIRYFPMIRHDIGDILPNAETTHFTAAEIRKSRGPLQSFSRGLSNGLLTLLLIVICVAPFVLGAGLLITAAVWMLLVFPYGRLSERIMIVVMTIVAAALPTTGSLTALPGHVNGTAGTLRWSCITEYCPQESRQALELLLDDGIGASDSGERSRHESTIVAVALGRLQFAIGQPDQIPAIRSFLDARKDSLESPMGQVLMGNIIVLDGLQSCPGGRHDTAVMASAMGWYSRALTASPDNEAANRGMAVASGLAGDRKGMELSLQRVLEITRESDLDFMAQVRTLTASSDACSHLTELAGELRPPRPLSNHDIYFDGLSHFELLTQTPPLLPFKSVLIGVVRPAMIPLILSIMLAVAVALVFINPRHRRAVRCPACGHVICPSCNRRASGFEHCPICLFDQVRPAFLDPKDVAAMSAFQHRGIAARYWLPAMSIAIPGSGQILGGRPFRGLTMMLLLGLGSMMVITPSAPIIDSFAYIPQQARGLPLLPPVLLVSAYLWSVIDVIITRKR